MAMSGYGNHSDSELMLLLRESNERALTEIFDRYWHKLLAVALNRLDNLEEAEECVQDVFVKLWKLRESIQLKYSLHTYLSAAVRYRVFDVLDKQYRKTQYASEALENIVESVPAGTLADDYVLEKELMEQIEAAVRLLPEKCQIVYRKSREEGLSHKHIADELHISEKTVEAHLGKAIKDIRGKLTAALPTIMTMLCFHDIHL